MTRALIAVFVARRSYLDCRTGIPPLLFLCNSTLSRFIVSTLSLPYRIVSSNDLLFPNHLRRCRPCSRSGRTANTPILETFSVLFPTDVEPVLIAKLWKCVDKVDILVASLCNTRFLFTRHVRKYHFERILMYLLQ